MGIYQGGDNLADYFDYERENLAKAILNDPLMKEIGLGNMDESELRKWVYQATKRKSGKSHSGQELKRKLWEQSIFSLDENMMEPLVGYYPEKNFLTEDKRMQEGQGIRADIVIHDNNLAAKIKLYPPEKDGKSLSQNEIMDIIHEHKIIKGIHEKYVERLAKFPVYGINFQIAAGLAPINGQDGQLICHFELSKDGIEIDENGMVDFKNMSRRNQVSKDELLGEIIPPTEGQDGYNIFGEVLQGQDGQPVPDPLGNNTYLSEDGLKIYSGINGNAVLLQGKISVQEILDVDNVDYSTGNITFPGDVNVKGDVRSGFSIRAGGSINVMGNVEDTVILEAEHDIVLRKGVNGRNGHITANGDLRAGYIQHADVKVKNNVFADSIINSVVECGGSMTLNGKNGRVVGGVCRINQDLFANEIGNSANIYTAIELIGPYKLLVQKTELDDKIAKNEEAVKKLEVLIAAVSKGKSEANTTDSRKNILKFMLSKKQLEAEITKLTAQSSLVSSQLEAQTVGKIMVTRDLHMNVHIDIDGLVLHNTDSRGHCSVYQKDNKIVIDEA